MVMGVRRVGASLILVLLAVQANCQVLTTAPYVTNSRVATLPRPYGQAGNGQDFSNSYYQRIHIRKFFNSFTSYEFPNPFPPNQDPLSRLEFPIDQWFAGIASGHRTSAWSFQCEAWTNINRESVLKMQDSDWDDETMPFQKTIFSESKCRLNRSWLADVRVAMTNPLALPCNIGPVIGARYQHFSFTTHDGIQMDLAGGLMELPGDGIDFKQTFRHIYFGVAMQGVVRMGTLVDWIPPIPFSIDFDYGLVTAVNEDLHLLRMGERVTMENTRGHCWHIALTAGCSLRNLVQARVEVDFKRILTTGSHNLTNPLFSIDFSFSGSRVWSEQIAVTGTIELPF